MGWGRRMADRYLTARDVADLLRVSLAHAYARLLAELPAHRARHVAWLLATGARWSWSR